MFNVLGRPFALVFVLAIFLAAPPSRPAVAIQSPPGPIVVRWSYYNFSDRCAWVTSYWSYRSEAHWRMVSGSRWVAAHNGMSGDYVEKFNHATLVPQLKFRAEVRPSATCSGSGGQNIWAQVDIRRNTPVFESTNYQRYRIELLGSGGNNKFHVTGPT